VRIEISCSGLGPPKTTAQGREALIGFPSGSPAPEAGNYA
jgi:hypothetical protein